MTLGDLKGCARAEEQGRAPEGGHGVGRVKFNLRNLAWGEGQCSFRTCQWARPRPGRTVQANNGDDAIEGTECQHQRLRPKEPVFAVTQGYTCSLESTLS